MKNLVFMQLVIFSVCLRVEKEKIPPKTCYDPNKDIETRTHCKEAENALAAYHNIKLID